MLINEILKEGLSPIVYHYTNIFAGEKIVTSGEFELSSTLGSVEEQYAPRGYPYFLSTTRTKTGGYHKRIGDSAVMFVLDGTWYNQRYPANSVDYWVNRNPAVAFGYAHEAEDRLFSRTPTIPIDGVTSVHVLLDLEENPEPNRYPKIRKLLLAAKRRGISAYFYTEEIAWRRLDTSKTGDVSVLKQPPSEKQEYQGDGSEEQEYQGYRSKPQKGDLHRWLELIGAQKENQLSKEANSLKYSLRYHWDNPFYLKDIKQGLSGTLSNARKPNSGPDRDNATKIIAFMRKNNFNTVMDLVNYLANKWKDR